ncbi:MAG: phosphate ABC transporter substrate-binding protein PstS family protein, partial [Chloroflexi bacterium]|nr:phosphate ABC transporter substrate-binding protein PstS family protein [Chloroflexota bacterium]
MRRLLFVLTFVMVLSAACAPAATSTPVPATAVPTKVSPTAVPTQPQPTAVPPTAVPQPAGNSITLAGSTTVQPVAEKLAAAFMAKNPGVQITVQGGGSSVGVKSAGQGTVDIGMASREIKESELQEFADLKVYIIARDGIAVVAHPQVALSGLTKEQVRDIFAGKITNWNQVGGPSKNIIVVSREEGSGTRGAFEELVMGADNVIVATAILQPSNGAVRTTVATTPDSIGYVSFGYLDASVKALAVNGVESTVANAKSGTYPVVRPLNMLTKGEPSGLVKAFMDFIMGSEGQTIVEAEKYMS